MWVPLCPFAGAKSRSGGVRCSWRPSGDCGSRSRSVSSATWARPGRCPGPWGCWGLPWRVGRWGETTIAVDEIEEVGLRKTAYGRFRLTIEGDTQRTMWGQYLSSAEASLVRDAIIETLAGDG